MLAGGLYERASGAAGQPLGSYQRRAPERTVLRALVARHAQSMLAELRDADPDAKVFVARRPLGTTTWNRLLRIEFAPETSFIPSGRRIHTDRYLRSVR
ncbi:MAG: hypothetical protein SFX73_26140 [Kofleriaceae bacterium]|nr:hypothetical protein [Kofleriaceae bacterium]